MARLNSGLSLSEESEKAAGEVIQSVRGDAHILWTQDTHGPDLRIFGRGGKEELGIAEVKLAVSEKRQQFWDAIDKKTVSGSVPLPAGLGTWNCTVSESVRVDRLVRALPNLVEQLNVQGSEYIYPWNESLYREHSIMQLTKVSGEQDRCFISLDPESAVQVSLDDLDSWLIDKVFNYPAYSNSWLRLQHSEHSERHAFIWLMEGAPKPLHMYMMLHSDQPPSQPISLPHRITHLWLVTPSVFSERNFGWLFTGERWNTILVK